MITEATICHDFDGLKMIQLFLSRFLFLLLVVVALLCRTMQRSFSSPVDYEKQVEWNTTLSLERLIERVGAFIHGIYVKLINESYFPFHRQRRNDLTKIYILASSCFSNIFHFKFVMRGQLLLAQ